jgi:endoglucanase
VLLSDPYLGQYQYLKAITTEPPHSKKGGTFRVYGMLASRLMGHIIMKRLLLLGLLLSPPSFAVSPPLLGVNLSGLESGKGGALGFSHVAPAAVDIALAYGRGIRLFRVPIRAVRLAPAIGAPVDPIEARALRETLDRILARPGTTVLIDWHDFGKSYGLPYGTTPWTPVTIAAHVARVLDATGRRNDPRVMVGLQNEPVAAGVEGWWAAAQQVTLALRAAGIRNWLSVSGANYAAAAKWGGRNGDFARQFTDPLRHTVFETHQYFDADGSGTASACVPGSERRLDPALRHAEANGYKLLIGELAFGNDSTCDAVRSAAIARIKASPAVYGVTFWTLGNFALYPRYVFGLSGPAKGQPSVLLDRLIRDWRHGEP